MEQPRIAVAMIVRAVDEEASLLAACLASVSGYVDAIYLGLNYAKGEQVSEKVRKVAKMYDAVITEFEWPNSFVKARNLIFSQVPKEFDWLMWLDSDDTVDNPQILHSVVSVMPKDVHGIYAIYDYDHDEYGNVLTKHWVCRLVRNNGSFAWKSSIDDEEVSVHETLVPLREVKKTGNNEFAVIHHADHNRRTRSLDRNIELLEGMLGRHRRTGKIDPRILFYLATHYFDAMRYPQSKELLFEYLQLSGWGEERSEAHVYMGKMLLFERKPDQARIAFLMAQAENPNNPHPLIELGELEYRQQRYGQAMQWLEMAKFVAQDIPDTTMVQRPGEYTYRLHLLLAQAYSNLGGVDKNGQSYLDKALAECGEALKLRPNDPVMHSVRDTVAGLVKYRDEIQAVTNVVHKFERGRVEQNIIPFLDLLPADLQDAMPIVAMRHRYTKPVKWPNKSLALYVAPGPLGIWGPWSLADGGLGGSEEAVIRLSKEMHKLGWRVTVFGTPGDRAGVYDGITWKQHYELNPHDEFDVVVAWRNPWFFDMELRARKKYIWLHDVMDQADFIPERMERVDGVIFVSQFHADLFKDVVPADKIIVSGNGIDPTEFDVPMNKRDPYRMLYMSSHVRGLNILLDIWPAVKRAVPKATLDIYYGWEAYDAVNRDNPERMLWKGKMLRTIEGLDGVTDRGRVGQGKIVQEIAQSSILAYPCTFPEVYCITLIKAMAGGMLPVTSDYGTLKDFNPYAPIHFDRYPTEQQIKQYKDRLIKELKAAGANTKLSQASRKNLRDHGLFNFTWEKTAQQWSEVMSGK